MGRFMAVDIWPCLVIPKYKHVCDLLCCYEISYCGQLFLKHRINNGTPRLDNGVVLGLIIPKGCT